MKRTEYERTEQGAHMSTIHFHQTTTSTPERYVAGLSDFAPGRWKGFGHSADEYLKVHHRGRSQADVTEGRHLGTPAMRLCPQHDARVVRSI
jgi:hypothetical protein